MAKRRVIIRYIQAATLVAVLAYCSTYVVLTRHAMAKSEEYGLLGYYFVFPPEDSDRWRTAETRMRYIFLPLIYIEATVGSDTVPAHEPLWSLN